MRFDVATKAQQDANTTFTQARDAWNTAKENYETQKAEREAELIKKEEANRPLAEAPLKLVWNTDEAAMKAWKNYSSTEEADFPTPCPDSEPTCLGHFTGDWITPCKCCFVILVSN